MHYLHFRSYRALLVGVFSGGLVLAACQPAGNPPAGTATPVSRGPNAVPSSVAATNPPSELSPTSTTAEPSAALTDASSAAAAPLEPISTTSPTPVPPLGGDAFTAVALADSTSSAIALSSRPLPLANRLSADQPWFLVVDEHNQCGQGVSNYRLLAIDRAGQPTQLDRGVTASAQRPGMPPLLATCAADGTSAIADPVRWSSLPLSLDPGVVVTQLMLSPDRQRAAVRTTCWLSSICDNGRPILESQILDLRSGAMRPAPGLPVSSYGGGPGGDSVGVSYLAWGAGGLYYSTSRSKAGGTTVEVIDPNNPQAGGRELARNAQYVLDSDNDLLITLSSPAGYPSMVMFDLRHGTTQTIDQAAWLSVPAIAPDGTALSYFRSEQDLYNVISPTVELVVFDIAHNTKTVLTDTLGTPFEVYRHTATNAATLWSRDSQRLIAFTQNQRDGQHASLLARDGALISAVALSSAGIFGVTNDDQIVLDEAGLTWLPLRPGAAPYAPNVSLTDGNVDLMIYAPPADSSAAPLPPVAATTRLPVTQLPTPAVPTPLQAALAPIKQLGSVSGEVTLFSDLPIYDHVLYRLGGTLYSQALRGGAAVSLGGDDQYWTNSIAISPDGKTCVYQLQDAVYRVPIAGGRPVRITPPLTEGITTTIASAQTSPDGRYVIYGVLGPKPAAWKDRLREDGPWTIALYSVPVAGGTPVRLSPPLDPDSTIFIVMLSADSRRVIYTVHVPDSNGVMQPDGKIELRTAAVYSVPIGGGAALRLAESTSADDPIGGMRLSDDQQYLLYQPRSSSALWSVRVDGGPPARLDTPAGEQIGGFTIGPDRRSVLIQSASGLSLAPIGGGAAVNLTSSLTLTDGLYFQQFTPDGTQVVFRTGSALYRVPSAGGKPIRLSGLAGVDMRQFGVVVANQQVLYQDGNAIYAIALAGGAPARLTPPLPPSAQMQFEQLSPDARFLIYTAEDESLRTRAIYSVPISGGTPALLLAGRDHDTLLYSLRNGYAIGIASGSFYAAPLDGKPRVRLSQATTSLYPGPVISQDGRHAIYFARRPQQSSIGTQELFAATLPAIQP